MSGSALLITWPHSLPAEMRAALLANRYITLHGQRGELPHSIFVSMHKSAIA